MNRYFYSIVVGFVACLACSCGNKGDMIQPQRMDLTEAVYASGNVYPHDEYTVAATADGILSQRLVDPGDSVHAGQLLFRIDSEVQDARYTAANRIYRKTRENYSTNSPALAEAALARKSAQEKLALDSLNYMRYKNLYETNVVAKAEYDRMQLAYELSRNEYRQRLDAYQKLKNQLYVDMQNAESNYNVSRKEAGNTSISSDIGGLVYDVLKEQGEAVRRNDVLALVGDAQRIYLKLVVDELDIAKVQVGQEVFAKLDIEPGKVFRAHITKVYPRLNREDQSFRVDAEFVAEKPGSFYGVTAEANIVVRTKQNVLVIPKSALQKGDSVWVKRDGDKVKVKLRKGIENTDYVEVLGGIEAGEEIYTK